MKTKIVILFFFMLTLSMTVASANPTMKLQNNNSVIDTGEQFDIIAYATTDTMLDTLAIEIMTFDGEHIECIDITRGDFFPDDTVWIPGKIEKHRVTGVAWGAINEKDSGQGVFATYTFLAKQPGTLEIKIKEAGAAFGGNIIPIDTENCYVTIEGEPYVPTSQSDSLDMPLIGISALILVAVVIVLIVYPRIKKRKKQSDEEENKEDTEQKETIEESEKYKTD